MTPPPPTPDALRELARALPELVRLGTSTWTYPGWAGLVYQRSYPKQGAAARMLAEYAAFPLFRTVGIDSSFYGPPTPKTLQAYSANLPEGFPCVSKVWDQVTVHTHAGKRDPGRAGEPNPHFLDADLFLQEMYGPYQEHFRGHAGPFVFEFQTIARRDGIGAQEFADRLDRFFSRLPPEGQYAVEIRNDEFLAPPYLAVLREHRVAHVLNSWTRMPPIGEQLDRPGAITAPFLVVRALLRPGRTYQEAVDKFQPYDRVREPNPRLRDDLVRVIERAVNLRIPAYVIVNNRAEGSAPLTIAAVMQLWAERQASGGASRESGVRSQESETRGRD